MGEWSIGLCAWIIQDGNYGDFHCGQEIAFALEFYQHSLQTSDSNIKTVKWLKGARYRVNAQVGFMMDGVWVIDFGLSAYQNAKLPATIRNGDWISAEIDLGIDPFFYFESLSKIEAMPPLIYGWRVREIGIQTAPFVETHRLGGRVLVRDESKSSYRRIEATNAWKDGDPVAEYVLRCELVQPAPTRVRPRPV
jgi:hypothetical protein